MTLYTAGVVRGEPVSGWWSDVHDRDEFTRMGAFGGHKAAAGGGRALPSDGIVEYKVPAEHRLLVGVLPR